MLVRTELQALLSSARRGDAIVYHTGFLLNDRQKGSQLEATADAAWAEHLAGRCTLVQRRLGPSSYEYIAIKLDPARPVRYIGCYDPDRLNYHVPGLPKRKIESKTPARRGVGVADWLPSAPVLPGR